MMNGNSVRFVSEEGCLEC